MFSDREILEDIAESVALPMGWDKGLRGCERMGYIQRKVIDSVRNGLGREGRGLLDNGLRRERPHKPTRVRTVQPRRQSLGIGVPYYVGRVWCQACQKDVEMRAGCSRPVCSHSLQTARESVTLNPRETTETDPVRS